MAEGHTAGAMLEFNDVFYFVQVAERRGFTAASHALGISKSNLSRRIQQLEQDLGVRLLNRTPRQLALTDAGQEFLEYAKEMVRVGHAAETAIKRRLETPSGNVRITTTLPMAQFVMRDLLGRFLGAFPSIDVTHNSSDALLDLWTENYDIALRAHTKPLADSSLVHRTLCRVKWFLVASPDYLERHPDINVPSDLTDHRGLHVTRLGARSQWRLQDAAGAEQVIPFTPRLASNDITVLKDAAVSGFGPIALPSYSCTPEIRDGSLVRLLPDWIAADSQISMLMPTRAMLPSVRALADFLVQELPSAMQ